MGYRTETVSYYHVSCDWPGCRNTFGEHLDAEDRYTFMFKVIVDAEKNEWATSLDGSFCPRHSKPVPGEKYRTRMDYNNLEDAIQVALNAALKKFDEASPRYGYYPSFEFDVDSDRLLSLMSYRGQIIKPKPSVIFSVPF